MKTKPWTPSKTEEVIAALWLIAGLLAWLAGLKWLAWTLFVKCVLDVICCISFAIFEIREEQSNQFKSEL